MCMPIAECVYVLYVHVYVVYVCMSKWTAMWSLAYHCQSIRTCYPCQISTMTFYSALYLHTFYIAIDFMTEPNKLWTTWTQFWRHYRFSKYWCVFTKYIILILLHALPTQFWVINALKVKVFSDNFYRLFQYLVVFTDEFGHWLDICFYWDCYWDIFVIERNDWFHI